jgi:hypothetical protein
MYSISDDTYNNILSLLEQGVSIRKIADQHHISKSKIQKIRAQHLPNLKVVVQQSYQHKTSAFASEKSHQVTQKQV